MSRREPKIIDARRLAEHPLPEHAAEAGKGDRGKLLIVAGSVGLPGAAILSARAALRVGCGTVRAAVPRSAALAVGAAVPELMVLALPETDAGTAAGGALAILESQVEPCDAVVIGPGMGSHAETRRTASKFLEGCPLPTVVDAEALNAWGEAGRPAGAGPRVLTPHALEMARLIGVEPEAVEADREALAARHAEGWGCVLVLKGRETLVAGRDFLVNRAGTPGLGTAGSGDVLAGVIGGLLARGADPTTAAAWGVHLHALAGEAAARKLGDDGLIASDVVDHLPEAMLRLLAAVQA
ncbi:NAD(P)H-hydrate dehydratase [Paludisphaera soli]|uniref:NAD(P)H-hydrate dehydratase n=1 Tax=Paludisphaera soli TaxID=2712865 RepID=UPI0013EA89AE|nr:NAD(P)H-hydrate dehydratase [Paludisphaera soli]